MPKTLPSKTYLEVSLCGRAGVKHNLRAAADFLTGFGISEHELVTTQTKTTFKVSFYTRSAKKTGNFSKKFSARKIKGLNLKVRILGRRDWLDKWKLYYRLTPLGRRFVIVPLWEKDRFCPGQRFPIYLEPGGAFGSGLHETTRLVVSAMEKLQGRFKSFLDLGTGTGILAIAAARLGADRILGIDNDKQSVIVAKTNFKINHGLGGSFVRGDLKRVRFPQRYDLVAANLLSRTLIENRGKIQSAVKHGGHLLVSGIHQINLRNFLNSFPSPAFSTRKIFNSRSWSAVLWRRVR